MTDIVPPLEQVPIQPLPPLSERERIHACAMTAISLMQLGEDISVTDDDEAIARAVFSEGRTLSQAEMKMPGVVLKLDALLNEYDYALIEDANRIRNYVVNRLLEESTDRDTRCRLKALELLGKLSNVSAFTEHHEIKHIHEESTEELERRLRESLASIIDVPPVKDAELVTPAAANPPTAPDVPQLKPADILGAL